MTQVAAKITTSKPDVVAGAMIWAYERLLGRKPVSKASWLYPLALSALETANWKAMWNWNTGNVTTYGNHDWFYNPKVTDPLKFMAFPTLGGGCLAQLHWLQQHGAMEKADVSDYQGFMNSLEEGCYAGCQPYPSLQRDITALENVQPRRYWELSSAATLAIAVGIIGVGIGGAYLIDPKLFELGLGEKKHAKPRLAAAENPVDEIQSLLFKRKQWELNDAKEWAREHDFKVGKVEISPNYIRIRQQDPNKFTKLRTKTLSESEGIKAILGFV